MTRKEHKWKILDILLIFLVFISPSKQDCSGIEKCNPCSQEQCGNECYEKGFLGLFDGVCKFKKVHGAWSSWGNWAQCANPCGYATKKRHRHCNNPSPRYQGNQCPGNSIQTAICDENPFCPDCDINEGQRTYQSSRDPIHCLHLGHCFEKEDLGGNQKCYYKKVHGKWSSWSGWGECTPICGGAWQRRERSCTNPIPQYHGDKCSGSDHEYIGCKLKLFENGVIYKGNDDWIGVNRLLATKVSKTQCVLKCNIHSNCEKVGFVQSEQNDSLGACYSISRQTTGDESIRLVLLFDEVIAVKPGSKETERLREFC